MVIESLILKHDENFKHKKYIFHLSTSNNFKDNLTCEDLLGMDFCYASIYHLNASTLDPNFISDILLNDCQQLVDIDIELLGSYSYSANPFLLAKIDCNKKLLTNFHRIDDQQFDTNSTISNLKLKLNNKTQLLQLTLKDFLWIHIDEILINIAFDINYSLIFNVNVNTFELFKWKNNINSQNTLNIILPKQFFKIETVSTKYQLSLRKRMFQLPQNEFFKNSNGINVSSIVLISKNYHITHCHVSSYGKTCCDSNIQCQMTKKTGFYDSVKLIKLQQKSTSDTFWSTKYAKLFIRTCLFSSLILIAIFVLTPTTLLAKL